MNSWKLASASMFGVLSVAPHCAIAQDDPPIVEGLPEHLIYRYTQGPAQNKPLSSQEYLYAKQRRWEAGRTLRVCLFGGNRSVATLIREVAGEWNNYSTIKLDFGPPQAWYNCLSPQSGFFQIRIGFSERGYWSAVGDDSEGYLDNVAPSMNLESFNRIYTELKFPSVAVTAQATPYHKATIRHEFGHALGLLHEHQNPLLKCIDQIKLTGPDNVYDYLARPPNGWTPEQVDRNLGFVGQTDPDFVAGDPNLKSVMMYALPRQIFKDDAVAACAVPVNYEISEKDKQILARIYPAATGAQVTLDLALSTSGVKPLPRVMSAPARDDLLERITVDLESGDTFVRRDARVRLADLLQKGATPSDVSGLVERMGTSSYRFQLGVAVALASAKGKVPLDNVTRQRLTRQASSVGDPTLKRNLQSIVR